MDKVVAKIDFNLLESIAEVFTTNLLVHPNNIALDVDSRSYSYLELACMAESIAKDLEAADAAERVGIYAHRTAAAYAGILGTLASGRTYVPLNPKFPAERNAAIATSAGLQQIICDQRFVEDEFLSDVAAKIISFDVDAIPAEPPSLANKEQIAQSLNTGMRTSASSGRDGLAYIMFTSGTTGVPKGVPISHNNVLNYVANVFQLTELRDDDRFSQTFDLTFDLSVHDMFVCWAAGGSLHVLPERAVMAPAKFIKEHNLTVWFSVPSTIGFMQKLRMLRENSFPTLRCSWFCGEALPAESARNWQSAAPNSFVENLYGPTEATIAFTAYRWQGDENESELAGGYVPIGQAMGSLETAIIDESQCAVSIGESGELCLGGNQLSPGYWQNSEKTAEVFIETKLPQLHNERWYRTGDLAKMNKDGNIEFIGRLDSQVKILGHRVELGEVERAIRSAAGTDLVAAVAWPREGGSASGIAAFYSGGIDDLEALIDACKATLAPYMVPKIIRKIENFPMNANGKIDRRALVNVLENGN